MNSKTRLTVLVFISALLALGVMAELSYIKMTSAEAGEMLAEADTRSGNDAWTRNARSVQVNERDSVRILDDAKLTRTKLITLIDLLEKTGRSMNLSVVVTSVKSDASSISTSSPETVNMTVTTSGPWASSLAFIRLLENLPHKIYIDESRITKEGQVWETSSTMRLTTLPEAQ
ncbi:hypothetical protein KW796_02260 [Candidatus Parcubacteria bacterium]|nr:hypothetical protein [Candidatus Parcubacteria bacterium]